MGGPIPFPRRQLSSCVVPGWRVTRNETRINSTSTEPFKQTYSSELRELRHRRALRGRRRRRIGRACNGHRSPAGAPATAGCPSGLEGRPNCLARTPLYFPAKIHDRCRGHWWWIRRWRTTTDHGDQVWARHCGSFRQGQCRLHHRGGEEEI